MADVPCNPSIHPCAADECMKSIHRRVIFSNMSLSLSIVSPPPAAAATSSLRLRRQLTSLCHPSLPLFFPLRALRSFPLGRPLSLSLSPCALGSGSATGALLQDAGATAAVLAGAYSLVLTFDTLTEKNLIQQSLSRKLVHILSGLLFMASWPIFSNSMEARYFASFVPMVNCLRLVVNGLSLAMEEGLVKSVTREGSPGELLRGPLYYVLMLILCAVLFWRESPTGIIAVAMMCGGDGIADIIGRRFGSLKLPYNQQKSWAGSISMFAFGFLVSMGMLHYFSALGYFQLDWIETMQRVALISSVATVVESLPTTEVIDDNISVPLVSMLTASLTFHS